MGYTAKAEKNYWSWDQKDNKQYALLFLIIVIISLRPVSCLIP